MLLLLIYAIGYVVVCIREKDVNNKLVFVNSYTLFLCMCAQVAGETLHLGCIGQCCAQATSSSASSHRHLCSAQVTGECLVCTGKLFLCEVHV